MEKLAINGLKLSGPLIPMWIDAPQDLPAVMVRVCRMLTALRVNIAFLTAAEKQGRQPGMCCIDAGDHPVVEAAVRSDAALCALVTFGPEVGLLSFYPHQTRMAMLGGALCALAQDNMTIYGWASSISAITFVLDYDLLDKGAARLADCMALPPNPAAFRAEFKVRQEKLTR